MPGLISVNLARKCSTMSNPELSKFCEQIDDWLNENCTVGTFFVNRFMRFNFQNENEALAFKLRWG